MLSIRLNPSSSPYGVCIAVNPNDFGSVLCGFAVRAAMLQAMTGSGFMTGGLLNENLGTNPINLEVNPQVGQTALQV